MNIQNIISTGVFDTKNMKSTFIISKSVNTVLTNNYHHEWNLRSIHPILVVIKS